MLFPLGFGRDIEGLGKMRSKVYCCLFVIYETTMSHDSGDR